MTEANKQIINVGLIQMKCADNPDDNLNKAIDKIKSIAGKGAQIICLQELFCSKYFCQSENHNNFSLAEKIPGATTAKMSLLAKELSVVLIVPLFEQRSKGIYHNTAVVIDADGSMAGKYRKMHIPDDPLFYEKFYFTPGDTGFKSFPTRYGRVGVLICWDQWFPEAARLTALSGADFIFYPTAIGFSKDDISEENIQADAWRTIQRSHAIANGVFTIAVNRVGKEDEIQFWGRSFACDPFGKVLVEAGAFEEKEIIAKCDLSLIENTRQYWPFLRDRRIDAYGNISKVFIDPDE
ncbi:MAG: carbon-nitrogen hydrolase [Nitrospinales bacterium]